MHRARTAALLIALPIAVLGCSVEPERPAASSPSPTSEEPAEPETPAGPAEVDADLAARAAHTMTALPGADLLVVGGCDVDGCAEATASTYVVSGSSAERVPDLGQARDAHTAVQMLDGRVLVVGGFGGEGKPPLASAEIFDPVLRRWTTTGSMALGRGGHAAALLGDGRVLVAGGWVAPSTYTDTTEIFDPATGRFSPGPRLPAPADGLAAASLPDGCVLVVGGQVESGVATDAATTICPDGRGDDVEGLAQPRFKHGIAVLSSGRVLVVGGTPDDQRLLDTTEVYDPASHRFRPGPLLQDGRYKLTDAVLALPGDRAIVAGGGRGVEVVDVGARRSRAVLALAGGRRSFSTLGVADGRVVLLGGYDEEIRLTQTYASVPLEDL